MKRLGLAIFLVAMSGAVAGSLYSWLRVPASDERCTMNWLAGELALDTTQYGKVWAVHARRCPEIRQLCAAEAQTACEQATEGLIAEVSAVLTPEQRGKYEQLVAHCRQETAATP